MKREGETWKQLNRTFLLVLRDSPHLLSSNRNNSQNLSDELLSSFLQRVIVDFVETQEKLNMIFKHHLSLSQENGLFQYFMSSLASLIDVRSTLTSCHVNTMLVISCLYYCHVMGCLPQPIAISHHDSLFSVVYTSGSTGFTKGTACINTDCTKYTCTH